MKILDRYIISSVAATFLFGVCMFLVLLLAMDLLPDMIEYITEKHVPAGMALTIFAYQVPSMLVYAFPMSVLLCILLVFNRMSSESEMVAIRAGGVSFMRIVAPTLLFALLITGLTFAISNAFVPFASSRAAILKAQALQAVKTTKPVPYIHLSKDGTIGYAFVAANLDVKAGRMSDLSFLWYEKGRPAVMIFAKRANWDIKTGHWQFDGDATVKTINPDWPDIQFESNDASSRIDINAFALRLEESPFDIAASDMKPEELTAAELQRYVTHLQAQQQDVTTMYKAEMELARRYSVPFSCLVFALIGAPLGLRHHRTSSAMGLGVSLLMIIVYYFIAHYLAMFGESGRMPTVLAAWLPNIIGGALGTVLIVRANR